MGLNDTFLTDDSMETKPPVVKVNALKNTAPGEQPELNDKVDLIAFDEQWEDEERQAHNDAAALEELHIRANDLQFLHENLLSFKGMSQQIALECQKILPDFISAARPLASYSSQLTAVGYKAALEEVEQEKKGVIERVKEFVMKIFQRLGEWLAKALGRKTPSNSKAAVASFEEKMKTKEPDWKRATKAVDAAEVSKSVPSFGEIKTYEDLQAFMEDKPVASEETKPEVAPEKVRNAVKDALAGKLLHTCSESKLSYIAVTGLAEHGAVIANFQGIIEKILDRNFFTNSGNRAVYEAGTKALDELEKALAQAAGDKENFSELFAGTLLREKNYIYDTAQQGAVRKLIAVRNTDLPLFVDMRKIAADAVSEGGDASKAIADNCTLAMRAIKHLFELVRAFDTFYIEFGMVNGFGETMESVPANESMDLPPGAENAYNSPLMNVAGGYVAAGAEPPTPGGFAEYYFGVKQAEVLAGSLNPDGSVVVSPRTTLIARIATLQEALKNLDAGMQPSLESIDILSEKLRPREALAFSSKALAGKVPRAEFEKEMAASNVSLAKELTNSAAAMASGVAEIDEMSAMIKKFGIFSKPPAREATAEDIEKLMKIADAYQCGVVGFLGQPVQKPLMWNFAKAATRMHRTDVFNSRAFWPAVDELEKARFALFDKLDRELLDDHAAAAKLLADGLLGTPKDFFAHADEIYTETASSCRVISSTMDRDIKRYIAIAEKNGYDNDLKYFNQVLNVYEVTVKLLVFLARCCFTFNSIRKDFKV